jgi:hypothetical protein
MSSTMYKKCNNGCGKEIYFGDVKSAGGKSIPLERGTKDPHQCPNSDFNMRRDKPKALGKSVIDYVLEIKKDYDTFKAQTALRMEKLELSRWDFTTDDKVRALEEKVATLEEKWEKNNDN